MTPDEVRCMEKEKAIVVRANEKPCKLTITPFFRQRAFDAFVEYSKTTNVVTSTEAEIVAADIKEVIEQLKGTTTETRTKNQIKKHEDELAIPDMKGF